MGTATTPGMPTVQAPVMPVIEARRAIPWQARLVLLASIWGLSFMFIKVADGSLAPLQVALGRLCLGSVTLLVILAMRRESLPRELRVWAHLAVAGVLLNCLPFSLFAYGETHTTSVLAGIFNATTPLFTAPIALLMLPGERLSRERLLGLAIGFGGVLVVLGAHPGGTRGMSGGAMIGNLLCLGAAVSYGVGFPYTRRYLVGRGISMLSLATAQLLCATVELAIITPIFTLAPATVPLKVIVSVIVLGAVGTGIAYILNYSIIRDAGPTMATTVAYIIPLFSTAAGVLVLGEPLSWYEPVGAVVVIVGVAVSQGRVRLVSTRPRPLSPRGESSSRSL